MGKRIFLGNFYPSLVFLAVTFEQERYKANQRLKRLVF